MALFKILKGNEANLPSDKHEGWAYVTEKGNMYVDLSNDKRVKIGNRADTAEFADKATGDTQTIRSRYLARIKQVTSDGTQFTFRGETGDGTNAPDLISIPLAGNKAGLVSNAAQTIKGEKTFANGIKFPDVTSTTYPAVSAGLTWSGSTDGAKIYYEVQASDKGMLIIEARDDTNAGAIFRNSNSKKEVSIINGLVTGTFKGNLSGTASHATSDANGKNIASYVASVLAQSDNRTIRVTKGDGTTNDVKLYFAASSSFGGAADSANVLNINNTENIGVGRMQFFQKSGDATLMPDTNWWSLVRLQHGGYASTGYWTEMAYAFHSDTIKFRRNQNGTKSAWKTIAFTDGTIAKATQAEKDWLGQVIDETYMKYPLTISGEIITMTRGDGVTSTITVPDTKVTQIAVKASDYTNWRPIVWGSSNSGTEGFTPTTVRDQVYTAQTLSVQPSSGTIRATTFKGALKGNADTATNATYAEKDKEGNVIADSYVSTIVQNSSTGTVFSFKGVSANGDARPNTISIPAATATVAGLVTNAAQTFAGVKTFKNNIDVKGKVIIDLNGNKVEIGSDNKSYFHFLVRSQATTPLTFWFGGPIQTAGNITPYGHNTYNLGSSSSRWKTGYFGSGGINVSGTITDKDANELRAKLFVSTIYANTSTGSSFIIGGKNTAGDEITSLTIPNASTTKAGLVTNVAQTLAGNKTFTGDIYISHATVADMTYNTTNPKLVFSENGGQPVGIVYTDYDTYRSPAGLKIMSTVSNNGAAWLEVEGDLFVKGHIYDKNGDILLADRYVSTLYTHTSTASTFKLGGKNYDGDVICNHQIPNASTTVAGLITAEAQDLKGNKTLDGTFYGKANYHRFTAGQAIHRTYMPSGQGRPKGWYRIAKISGLENYAVFTLFITGGYHYGSPAVAQMHITLMHRTVRIRQMSGIAGLISKIRITGNQDAWYLEVYQNQTYAASETMGNQSFYLVGDVNAELYQPTTANGAAGELTIECPIRTYDNTYVNAGTANRMAYYSATGDISSTGHYASTTQIGINMTNTTTIGSNSLYVEGTSKFNGDLTVVGNAIVTKDIRMNTGGTAIYWDTGDYKQRILNTDDSTNNTDVFTFQQSSDSGSTWRNLLKIQDDGVLIVTDNTGQFRKNYASANTTPAILIGSKNQDISIWRVYSSDATYKAAGVYGYSLRYRGTQSGQNNYLTLYADAQTAANQVIAYSIDQAGNMAIRTEVDMNYSLFVNGTTKIKFRNDREIPWVSTANLNIGQSAGTLHITTNKHGSGTAIKNGNEASITFGTEDLAYAGIYSPTSGDFGNHLIFATTGSYKNGAYARMIIRSDGSVGIGSMTTNSKKFYVSGSAQVTNRLYITNWIEFTDTTGLYTPNSGAGTHFYPNVTSSYGSYKIQGAKGGYVGFLIGPDKNYFHIMSNSTNEGLYNESKSRWILHYNRVNNNISIGDSTSRDSYLLNIAGSTYIAGDLRILNDVTVDGVFSLTSWTGNSMVWTNASKEAQASNHYVNTDRVAINTLTRPGYNFYVNGSSYFTGTLLAASILKIGVSSTTSAPSAGIHIHDLRDCTITPNSFGDQRVNFYFDQINDAFDGAGAANKWMGIMHVKGWTGNYAAWQLAGGADSAYSNDTLRYRAGSGTTWGAWQSVLTDNNYKLYIQDYLDGRYVNVTGDTMTGRLHANGGISCGSYNNTSYTMSTASFICNSWVRTVGKTGWYSETYQGGIYMSDSTFVQVWNAKRFRVNNALHIHPREGNYCEGLRIYQYGSWSDILLGGNDLTANTGTSANSWFIGNNNGTLNITRNGSSTGSAYLRCVSNKWYINTTSGSEQLNVGGWVGTTGNSGWYNITHGGGWYQTDATYIRTYGTFQVYSPGRFYSGDIGTSWIDGLKNVAAYRVAACSDTGSYHPWLQQTNTASGYAFSIGILGSTFRFIGCPSSRTANSYTAGIVFDIATGYLTGPSRIYSAVWNDYAEYRETKKEIEPGRVVIETGFGDLELSSKRLQPGANVVSDTFGFAIGETDKAKTPIAVSGRALVYPYENKDVYKAGDAVCTGPNGTVSKMTREEITMYPERIVGTVSEIPEYDEWGQENVKVNGRIWIKVR